LLGSARCLVLPSLGESFGLVLLEAWTHETPVVTYDLPVFRGTVDHGENGFLVPLDSDRAMADAILTFLNDPSLAARFGAAGRLKVVRDFNWTAVAERFLRAYEYAIAARGNRGQRARQVAVQ
jgi:starch synthase